jgi:adenosyl cobinamide kinase/adenosyl cobinamide phosphate guanylyltransferase
MSKRLTLILGGARSGKSSFAQQLARERGGDDVLFVATAEARDEEMVSRIEKHRAARPMWTTLEAPRDVARAVATAPRTRVVLLDCVTLWVSNVLLAGEQVAEETMLCELDDLLAWYRTASVELIVVSNEVGLGIVPADPLTRSYRDLLGTVNQRLAAAADQVFWLVAGLPIEVKERVVQWK